MRARNWKRNSTMSSGTSTERGQPPGDAGFQAWHFFILLSMVAATVAVMLSRNTHPLALLLLSAAVLAAGLVGIALQRALTGFLAAAPPDEPAIGGRAREALARDKALVLRSIKELEFDHAMGKISEADFKNIGGRLRARALLLMQDLEGARPDSAEAAATASPPPGLYCAECGAPCDLDAKFCKHCGHRVGSQDSRGSTGSIVALCLVALLASAPARGQVAMPKPSEISGVPLPAADLAAGTVSVRVIRGSFANNLPGQLVEFTVDGKTQAAKTDAGGRAQISGLAAGVHVRAVTVVDGERLESQEVTIGVSGIRLVLVATDPEAVARQREDSKLAAGPAVRGLVVFGPESRIIVTLAEDRLTVYYVVEIVNTARTPVDIGGPLVLDLPADARGATLLDGSSPQATTKGTRLTVTGPFAPGSTTAQVAYEVPLATGAVRLEQTWPVMLQQLTVLVPQTGALDIQSPQIASKRTVVDQGQTLILASGPAIAADQRLTLDISGLPHHPVWPRYLALTLAGAMISIGTWAAVFVPARRLIARA